MPISTRGRYAVMAMVDIASHETQGCGTGPVCLAKVGARQQLSLAYLERLLGKLRRAGQVRSARGPGGGYRIARAARAISVAEIVAVVDEPMEATRCTVDNGSSLATSGAAYVDGPAPEAPGPVGSGNGETTTGATSGSICQAHDLWFELGRQIALFLSGITFSDVVPGHVAGRAASLPASVPHYQDAE